MNTYATQATTPLLAPHVALSAVLPDDTVHLTGTDRGAPMRAPDAKWGLVIRAVRISANAPRQLRTPGDKLGSDPSHVDIARHFAAAWLPREPDAALHTGDVVVRLEPPPCCSPHQVDVEAFVAMHGVWVRLAAWPRLDRRWPHYVATTVHEAMANVATVDQQLAQLAHEAADGERAHDAPPDALAGLMTAGLLKPGSTLHCGINHRATVTAAGVLVGGRATPNPRTDVYAVHSLATDAIGHPVNGWHVLRTSGGKLLAGLRDQLAQS